MYKNKIRLKFRGYLLIYMLESPSNIRPNRPIKGKNSMKKSVLFDEGLTKNDSIRKETVDDTGKIFDNPVIETLGTQINDILLVLDDKMKNIIKKKEYDYLCAVKDVMKRVIMEINDLRHQLDETNKKFNEDNDIYSNLKKQIKFFRDESLDLSKKLNDALQKNKFCKEKAEYLEFELSLEHKQLKNTIV